MHKSLIALVGATGIGLAALATPAPANAGCVGCAVGAGIIGGVAAGAIIGSAIANSPPPGYYPPRPDIIRLRPATTRRLREPMGRRLREPMVRPRPAHRRRPHTLKRRPAVIGGNARFGSKAWVIRCGLSKSVRDVC